MYNFSTFNWITVAMCSRTFAQKMALIKWMLASTSDRQVSHRYKLNITILIQFFPFLKCVYFFWQPLYIYLLTYSMVQSPSWEANWFAASQEIPHISRNPKVHYRTHKRPPLISILSQPNPVHIPTSHLLETHPNIIHPSTPRTPQWSLSLRLHHQYIYIYI